MDYDELAIKLHKKFNGKITTSLRDTAKLNKDKLSAYYTPGVAAVSKIIAKNPEKLNQYTWVKNVVAIISDGSAVLGLGSIGPKASMPVMEGKAMLFKELSGIDGIPITISSQDVETTVQTIKNISTSFGAINLEDFAAPKCFEIEKRLIDELDIPIMHDDQHGTAIVVLAGLINALKVSSKQIESSKIVVAGTGAAGSAIIRLLNHAGFKNIIAVDSKGIIHKNRNNLDENKKDLLNYIQKNDSGSLSDAIIDADVFIGVSQPGIITGEDIKKMSDKPIVFALANPIPEIAPDLALGAGAFIVATGRSDYPNQINNALAFPGIFRGALDNNVKKITTEHKIAAAYKIASIIKKPTVNNFIPSIFEKKLVLEISKVII